MDEKKKDLLDDQKTKTPETPSAPETPSTQGTPAVQKPGAYESKWTDRINGSLDKILNRKDFTYDINGDALYQQYKDRYVQQGKMAMIDTLGQAATLTGGYGNSYAQMAGQQAYGSYLQGLNDKIPELYQLALDKYNQDGDNLYKQYSLLSAQEGQDYDRFKDSQSLYQQEWENALRLYQLDIKTPEVLAILGIPEEAVSGGGGGDGGSGRGRGGSGGGADLVKEATRLAQGYGTETAYQYIKDQTGGNNAGTMANAARENAKGVAMTEHYKKMAEALKKK